MSAFEDDYRFVGEGPGRIHAVHRGLIREQGKRMTQGLCKAACIAYSPLDALPDKKPCGNCRKLITLNAGLETPANIGYGSRHRAQPAPQHHP